MYIRIRRRFHVSALTVLKHSEFIRTQSVVTAMCGRHTGGVVVVSEMCGMVYCICIH